jgi:alpha-beta hydrolase superfamily lysophospholipase
VNLRRVAIAAMSAMILVTAAGCDHPPPEPGGSKHVSIPTAGSATLDAVELGSGPNVAILTHGATGTKEGYYPLMPVVADAGWRAIAYDAEGVGDSTGDKDADREGDLRAAVAYARSTGGETIALVGASLGAFLSLSTAEELHADGVVALSPYLGLPAEEMATSLDGIPTMLVVAEDNEPYASDTRELATALGVEPVVVSGENHGTGVLTDHPDVSEQIATFLQDRVSG